MQRFKHISVSSLQSTFAHHFRLFSATLALILQTSLTMIVKKDRQQGTAEAAQLLFPSPALPAFPASS
jgi:hypothetical protein